MAAQPLVRYSYANPVETYATNVMGTGQPARGRARHAWRARGGQRHQRQVLRKPRMAWGYRENEAMGGYDPYSNSKGCAELVTAGYRSSFFNAEKYAEHGVALGSGRAGNVIGGGDWAMDRLIPDMLRAIGAGQPVMIRNPHAIRPWQHVLEPLSGYLTLAEQPVHRRSGASPKAGIRPARHDAKPVEWIIERMAQAWGAGASLAARRPDASARSDLPEARLLQGARRSWTGIRAGTSARPSPRSSNGIKPATRRADMRAFTLAQIDHISKYANKLKAAS